MNAQWKTPQRDRASYLEKAGHGLQATNQAEIDAILERRQYDQTTGEETPPVVADSDVVSFGRHR